MQPHLQPGTADAGSGASAYAALRECLEHRRYELSRELSAYPSPIPACDAHFNRLLEERGILSELVRLVDEAERRNPGDKEARSLAAALAARESLDAVLTRELKRIAG